MNKTFILLSVIFILALRLYQFGNIPEGFHADEAAFGYNTYSLIKTGRDEYGKQLPLVLKSFSDDKAAGYSYLSIPSVFLFGLTQFAVRLPSAIVGIIGIFVFYGIAQLLTGDKSISTITAILIGVSAPSITLSRVQSEPLIGVYTLAGSFLLMLLWRKTENKIWFIFSMLLALASIVIHTVPRMIIPVVAIIAISYDLYRKYYRRLPYLVVGSVILLVAITGISINGSSRFSSLQSVSSSGITQMITDTMMGSGIMGVPPLIARFFMNKPYAFIRSCLQNYFNYFNPNFLFLQANQPLRERIPFIGMFYLLDLPLFIWGLYDCIKRNRRWMVLPVLVILFVPAISAFTSEESPNIHRFYMAVPFALIIIASGISSLINYSKTKRNIHIVLGAVLLLYISQIIGYAYGLFVLQPTFEPYYRDYPYKRLVLELAKVHTKYKTVIFSKAYSDPYIHYLFHNTIDPKEYQLSGSLGTKDYGTFQNYIFTPGDCPFDWSKFDTYKDPNNPNAVLFVQAGNCEGKLNAKLIDTVSWKNGLTAFQLVEYEATEAALLRINRNTVK